MSSTPRPKYKLISPKLNDNFMNDSRYVQERIKNILDDHNIRFRPDQSVFNQKHIIALHHKLDEIKDKVSSMPKIKYNFLDNTQDRLFINRSERVKNDIISDVEPLAGIGITSCSNSKADEVSFNEKLLSMLPENTVLSNHIKYNSHIHNVSAIDGVIDISHKLLGDQKVYIFIKGIEDYYSHLKSNTVNSGLRDNINFHDQSVSFRHLILTDNRLTDKCIVMIIDILKAIDAFVTINMSENSVSRNGLFSLTEYFISSKVIKKAILDKMSISDTLLSLFCNKLLKSSFDILNHQRVISLVSLSLSKNQIGDGGIEILSKCLSNGCLQLVELDLSWNNIHAVGVSHLAKALTPSNDAYITTSANTLISLDLSWNSFVSSETTLLNSSRKKSMNIDDKADEQCEGSKSLSRLFEFNISLTHVNLSYNRLTVADCQIINQGLANNHTVLGLHMSGNDCEVNSFVQLNPIMKTNDSNSIYTANDSLNSHFKSGTITRSSGDYGILKSWSHQPNCWICEGWREWKFSLNIHPNILMKLFSDSNSTRAQISSPIAIPLSSTQSNMKNLNQTKDINVKQLTVYFLSSFDNWMYEIMSPVNVKGNAKPNQKLNQFRQNEGLNDGEIVDNNIELYALRPSSFYLQEHLTLEEIRLIRKQNYKVLGSTESSYLQLLQQKPAFDLDDSNLDHLSASLGGGWKINDDLLDTDDSSQGGFSAQIRKSFNETHNEINSSKTISPLSISSSSIAKSAASSNGSLISSERNGMIQGPEFEIYRMVPPGIHYFGFFVMRKQISSEGVFTYDCNQPYVSTAQLKEAGLKLPSTLLDLSSSTQIKLPKYLNKVKIPNQNVNFKFNNASDKSYSFRKNSDITIHDVRSITKSTDMITSCMNVSELANTSPDISFASPRKYVLPRQRTSNFNAVAALGSANSPKLDMRSSTKSSINLPLNLSTSLSTSNDRSASRASNRSVNVSPQITSRSSNSTVSTISKKNKFFATTPTASTSSPQILPTSSRAGSSHHRLPLSSPPIYHNTYWQSHDSVFADDKDAWLLFLHHSNESKLPKHVKNNSSLSKVNKNDVNLNYYDDCFEFDWNHVCNTRKIMKKLSLTNRNVKHWSSIDIPSFILYGDELLELLELRMNSESADSKDLFAMNAVQTATARIESKASDILQQLSVTIAKHYYFLMSIYRYYSFTYSSLSPHNFNGSNTCLDESAYTMLCQHYDIYSYLPEEKAIHMKAREWMNDTNLPTLLHPLASVLTSPSVGIHPGHRSSLLEPSSIMRDNNGYISTEESIQIFHRNSTLVSNGDPDDRSASIYQGGMYRFQFLVTLINFASLKFMESSVCVDIVTAFERFMNEIMLPKSLAIIFDLNGTFYKRILFEDQIDEMLRRHDIFFRTLFDVKNHLRHYAENETYQSEKITLLEFICICKLLYLPTDFIDETTMKLSFNLALPLRIADVLTGQDTLNIAYVYEYQQFLKAVLILVYELCVNIHVKEHCLLEAGINKEIGMMAMPTVSRYFNEFNDLNNDTVIDNKTSYRMKSDDVADVYDDNISQITDFYHPADANRSHINNTSMRGGSLIVNKESELIHKVKSGVNVTNNHNFEGNDIDAYSFTSFEEDNVSSMSMNTSSSTIYSTGHMSHVKPSKSVLESISKIRSRITVREVVYYLRKICNA